jgi:hypothetical protein
MNRMKRFKQMLSMGKMAVVDCEGKGGGLAVFWRRGIDVAV